MRQHLMFGILALTSALVAPSLGAQLAAHTKVGVAIGGTASRVTDLNVASGDLFKGTGVVANNYGVQVGVYLNYKFSDQFSLQPELYYVQKGTAIDFSGDGQAPGAFTVGLNYVEVPVLFRMDLGTTRAWHPFVTVGPSIAMRTSCKAGVRSSEASLSVDCEDIEENGVKSDPFEKTDIGVSVGAGLEGKLARRTTLLQLRYGRGLTTLTKNVIADQAPKHSLFSAIIGLSW